MTCTRIFDSAAYVLGTLPADEVADYRRHLETCAECQAEVMEFGGLPRLLNTVNLGGEAESRWAGPTVAAVPDEQRWAGPTAVPRSEERWAGPTAQAPTAQPATVQPASDNVLPFVITKARKQRAAQRRRGRLQAVGAALVAACLAALVVVVVQRPPAEAPLPEMVAMQQVSSTSPVTASVGVDTHEGDTRIVMNCKYTGANKGIWTFRMYVVPKYGNAEEVGSWTAGPGAERNYEGKTRFKLEDIKEVQLRKGDQTVLMTRQLQ